ncbi:hypothetical protein HTZ84_05225 [Haloterrigena sp. SYSU A558-1]|uniref:Uncharacterized protein n=1 Tax=Haloterrigena gelatinilytica TaxID=2741724 RepID=A0ABX2LAZ8_9EURY|nr:hypothetical protein [Haloterrigena gelatinilytica]NUC71715.1 hypothetical protein [Haloterrigena gelatinilytica]
MPDLPKSVPRTAWYVYLYDGTEEYVTFADGLVEEIPPRTVAESGSWQFNFRHDPAGSRSYDPLEHTDRYERVVEIGRWAGRYVLREPLEAEPRYREQVPPGNPSLLVGLQPAYETPAGGVWGLVDGYDETNALPETGLTVTLDVTMLATTDDYETRDEVVADLSF